MKILFALPGLHRFDRGAEIAFISIANELARSGDAVTLIGSGQERAETRYRFIQARSISRAFFQSFPSFPPLRNEYTYEELSFVPELLARYHPRDYDVTLTCSYPFTNWLLRRPTLRGPRPPHVFVTENGDWPATANNAEYRFFGCEGLICTNPDFYERNRTRWRCQLIPNGVDCERFKPGTSQRALFGLPENKLLVLIVSALIPSKRIHVGLEAASKISDTHLVIAGDGPLRHEIKTAAAKLMPNRLTLLSVPAEQMPLLYRSVDVFLHLSKAESFGNVFLEAMACGLPIVAHESSRLRWIVGDDQFLIDTDNIADVTAAIKSAINSPYERRNAAKLRALSFSWEKVGQMYSNFLRDVVRTDRK